LAFTVEEVEEVEEVEGVEGLLLLSLSSLASTRVEEVFFRAARGASSIRWNSGRFLHRVFA
jgi:hypothetical protein